MSIVYIYGLIDPRNNQVKYIGKTKNIKFRLKQHLNEHKSTLKANWIKSLRKQNLKPIIQVIDVCNESDWQIKERYWIGMFPNLLNMAEGGQVGCKIEFKARGENSGNSKLTDNKVSKIIELYKFTNLTSYDLSKLFEVKQITINCIISGRSWNHINHGLKTESFFKKKNPNKNGKQNDNYRGAKLSISDVIEIRKMIQQNIKGVEISKIYGVKPLTISNIKNGKSWRHI